MKISLVISVYKDVDSLSVVLASVLDQKFKDFEVIISQDCESDCFNDLIKKYSSSFPIQHLQQADNGFLKNQLLNQAIRIAKSDKMVFIDGDCMLHPKFLLNYEKSIREGRVCMGRRIDLDPLTTKKIKSGELKYPSFLSMLKNSTKRIEEAIYLPNLPQKFHSKPKLIGCNMAWYKADLIRLNGFDEDYINPGYGEDSDIEFRAKLVGMEVFSVRYKAIEFHLDHARPDREEAVSISREMFEEKKNRTDFRCLNGLEKLKDL